MCELSYQLMATIVVRGSRGSYRASKTLAVGRPQEERVACPFSTIIEHLPVMIIDRCKAKLDVIDVGAYSKLAALQALHCYRVDVCR